MDINGSDVNLNALRIIPFVPSLVVVHLAKCKNSPWNERLVYREGLIWSEPNSGRASTSMFIDDSQPQFSLGHTHAKQTTLQDGVIMPCHATASNIKTVKSYTVLQSGGVEIHKFQECPSEPGKDGRQTLVTLGPGFVSENSVHRIRVGKLRGPEANEEKRRPNLAWGIGHCCSQKKKKLVEPASACSPRRGEIQRDGRSGAEVGLLGGQSVCD
ncbi:hypothetical protein B0H16DRAFT_1457229 [Mycena metata]|uniref:Uncharacterized protein n=1 Tax=Mycena metata TaxID=1033252 RepID=A0AAD7J7J1_9AGAR|nr:hypothetical protein B0H16DRAFT_1457229 [Mycena metata]